MIYIITGSYANTVDYKGIVEFPDILHYYPERTLYTQEAWRAFLSQFLFHNKTKCIVIYTESEMIFSFLGRLVYEKKLQTDEISIHTVFVNGTSVGGYDADGMLTNIGYGLLQYPCTNYGFTKNLKKKIKFYVSRDVIIPESYKGITLLYPEFLGLNASTEALQREIKTSNPSVIYTTSEEVVSYILSFIDDGILSHKKITVELMSPEGNSIHLITNEGRLDETTWVLGTLYKYDVLDEFYDRRK